MTGRTHRIVGGSVAFVVASSVALTPAAAAALVFTAVATSSVPDSAEHALPVTHRRLTHYPVVQLLVVGLATYAVAMFMRPWPNTAFVLGAGVLIGCLAHSLADALTVDPGGMRLLWPISRRGYHLLPRPLRVTVGRKERSERLFVLVCVAFVLIYAYARFGSVVSA